MKQIGDIIDLRTMLLAILCLDEVIVFCLYAYVNISELHL